MASDCIFQAWLLLKASFWPLGALLDAFGAEKNTLERLLAGPRRISRLFSAILGAKSLPKGRPRGSKIVLQRRLELKMAKPQNLKDVSRNFLIFEVPSFLFGRKNRYKKASDCIFLAWLLLKASFWPLGALLEAFGAENK